MQIPLNQFEQIIDEKILKRGLTYFKKGHVQELEEINPNTYEAIVKGTEDYTVRLTVKNNVVTEHVCDCPYNMGPVCKHVAAVIFALQEDFMEMKQKSSKKKKNDTTSPRQKSMANLIDEMLSKATKEELKELIKAEIKRNANFKNLILTTLEQYNENASQAFYEQQIKAILKASVGRYGFLDYHGSIAAGLAVSQLLDTARNHINKQNFQNALNICFAVLDKMGNAINEADDSNGNIGGCISDAFILLDDITEKCEMESIRKQIFNFCVQKYERKEFESWDWHIDLISRAANLISTEEDFNRVLSLTEQPQQSEYTKEILQTIKYQLLLEKRGSAAAEDFLQNNLQNDRFRRIAIQKALENKDFDKAIKLAKDGVKQDMKTKPGLAMEWYDWLLKIAQAQNNTDKIIEYARFLLIDHFRHEQDYYQILKQHVKQEEWNAFVEDLVQDIRNKNSWYDQHLIAKIYIQEKWWGRLWEMGKKDNRLSTIEQYDTYLSKDYSTELAELYAALILQYLEQNMGRKHYVNACRYIRRIIKLGERAKAEEFITNLRTRYRNRPALIEELDLV